VRGKIQLLLWEKQFWNEHLFLGSKVLFIFWPFNSVLPKEWRPFTESVTDARASFGTSSGKGIEDIGMQRTGAGPHRVR
jgi:hypothetical protein